MRKIAFKSIRGRLIFWFFIMAFLPLFAGLVTIYIKGKKTIEEEAIERLVSIRDLKVQQVEKWLFERIGDVQVMAGDYEIRSLEKIFEKQTKSAKEIAIIENARELLNRNIRNYGDYEEIFIVGANTGIIEISSDTNSEGNNKSKEMYFTGPLESGKLFVKDIYFSQTLNRPQMTISSPIYCLEHGDHIVGILVARINLEHSLYSLLGNRVGLGETGETLIVNKNVVALNELRWYEDAPTKLKIKDEPTVNASLGETGVTKTLDYRGEEVLTAYSHIDRIGWGFICKQDMYELNSPVRDRVKNFIILFVVSAFLIVLIVFWIIKRIAKPIVDMDNATRKISSGDYSVRTVVNSKDEFASLADSINEMTASIESRIVTKKAVAEISEMMIGQSSMQGFGTKLLQQLMEITGANMSTFYILNEGSSVFEHFTSIGANSELLQSFNAENPEGEFGIVLSRKRIYYLQNIPENTVFKFKTTAGEAVPKEIITIPVLVEARVVAIISLVNMQKFSKECYDILEQSWTSINTSYSSLISNERTRILAEHLYKTNQQLEAQAEELQDQAEELQQQSEELQDQTEELQQSSEELQKQNIELDAQKKQVEAANKLKSEFLSNMSHELRTPLNSIMALSSVLISQTKDKLNDEENGYLEIIERNGRRLLALINDILDLSKIEAGRMDTLPELVSIGSLLKIAIENMQALCEKKGLTISISIPDNLPEVETDASKLHQILTNIVGNAVKFTEKGSVDVSVKLDIDNIIIHVKDSGIGISEEILPHIFEEFRQADGSSSRLYEGTGLGLAIANKLTLILGGHIDVESEIGKGSVFSLTFPLRWYEKRRISNNDAFETIAWQSQESANAVNEEISETRIMTIEDNPGEKSKVKGRRSVVDILIVEGNPDNMVTIKAILKGKYNTTEASDAEKGLKMVKDNKPGLILLDMSLPKMSGDAAVKALKNNSETQDVIIVAVTAQTMKGDREKFIKMGCDGYVSKPIDQEALFSEILRLAKI